MDVVLRKQLLRVNPERLEELLLSVEDQQECSITHEFIPGQYIRTVYFPAGTIAIGHEQKFEQLNEVVTGRVQFLDDETGELTEIVGPCTFFGKPGRKIGYIVEPTIWRNIFVTTETDIAKIEDQMVIKSAAFKAHEAKLLAAKQHQHDLDRLDFERLGVKNDDADFTRDINTTYRVSASPIHGQGIFLEHFVPAGWVIGVTRLKGLQTELGRFLNHSPAPSAKLVVGSDGDTYLVALKNIQGRVGGQSSEEVTIDYREISKIDERMI